VLDRFRPRAELSVELRVNRFEISRVAQLVFCLPRICLGFRLLARRGPALHPFDGRHCHDFGILQS